MSSNIMFNYPILQYQNTNEIFNKLQREKLGLVVSMVKSFKDVEILWVNANKSESNHTI